MNLKNVNRGFSIMDPAFEDKRLQGYELVQVMKVIGALDSCQNVLDIHIRITK